MQSHSMLPSSPGSIKTPNSYLGANLYQIATQDGIQSISMKVIWKMLATEYMKQAIQERECELLLQDAFLPKQVETPPSSNNRPELDFSWELIGSRVKLVLYDRL
jgi:hypothetical protein